jgi:hypothetical protein
MDFSRQLILLLVDKLGIGLLILFAGFLLNRILKRGELKIVLENELEKLRQSFANDLGKLCKSKSLEYSERQLSEFYWPLYVRWFTLNSLRSIREKHAAAKHQNVRSIAEQEIAVQSEMVDVIHRGIHLMEDNSSLFDGLRKFCVYSASFRAELDTVCETGEPTHVSELWPTKLQTDIVKESFRLQRQFDETMSKLNA